MWWHFACFVWAVILVRIDVMPGSAGVVTWLMMVSIYELVDMLGAKGFGYCLSLLVGGICAVRYFAGGING